jgi:uncharacterized membrane protein
VTFTGTTARPRAGWLVPAGLLLLTAIPLIAGAARLTELAGGAEVTPENARFFASPVPVVVHIFSVTVYSILGAFQFASGFRRRRPGRHRAAGRLLVVCGLGTALSGLWMTLFYAHPADTGAVLTGIRLVVGSAMFASIVIAFAAIRRRNIARHRAWMIRGYAIGLGAGTQVFTQLPWILVAGPLDKPSKALLMAAGWAINIAVAEWIIRRRPSRRTAGSVRGGARRPGRQGGSLINASSQG